MPDHPRQARTGVGHDSKMSFPPEPVLSAVEVSGNLHTKALREFGAHFSYEKEEPSPYANHDY